MKKMFATIVLALFSSLAFAGSPAGTTGTAPTTLIGPLTATKLELVDSGGFGYAISSELGLNASAAAAFIEFFDQPCAGVTLGTTKPSWIQPVLATNWSFIAYPQPLGFQTPICVVSVTAPNGTTGSAAASVFMQVFIP